MQAICARFWRGFGRASFLPLPSLALVLFSLVWLSAPATAQVARQEAGGKPIRVCGTAWATDPGGEDTRAVHALCWGTWLVLGQADEFRVTANFDLEATIVELERDGAPTVLLIRPDADGRPFIENLNATLAEAAGRSALGELKGLALDYGQFALTGRIDIAPGAKRAAGAEGRSAEADAGIGSAGFEIGDHISRDHARLAGGR